jgi:hypothetical protein
MHTTHSIEIPDLVLVRYSLAAGYMGSASAPRGMYTLYYAKTVGAPPQCTLHFQSGSSQIKHEAKFPSFGYLS